MHEGRISLLLGLKGMPALAEDIDVIRDIILAKDTGAHVHIAHVSTKGAVEAVRRAKAEGINVTCEVTPHHFTLTDKAVEGYDTNTKMNPPLRETADRDAMLQGIIDGSVDVIATDHAPHHYDEKLDGVTVMTSRDGMRAAAEFNVVGRYLVSETGLPDAKGQRYALPAGAFFAIRDGKIARVTTYYNLTEWIMQVSVEA